MAKVKGTDKFGMLLRKLRNQKGLGVNQLASYIGISGAEISRIERGERKKIAPDLLRELAPRLGVSYKYLMKEAGHWPGEVGEKEETYLVPSDPLNGLSQKDRKLVLDLIKRLKQE